MYELYIYKNSLWLELELSRSSNFSFVINSLLFGQKQSGSFSFSSSLDTTSTNCQVLQHSEEPQIIIEELQEYPAMLLYNSQKVYGDWFFVLKEAGRKEYKFDLIQNPANQPKSFYEKKLNQLDFGHILLETTTSGVVLTNIHATNDKRKVKSYFTGQEFTLNFGMYTPDIKVGFFFEILINNILVVASDNTNATTDANWWQSTDTLADRFNALMVQKLDKDNYTIVCSIDSLDNYSINVIVNNPLLTIDSVIMKIYNFGSYYDPFGNTHYYKTKSTLLETLQFYNCSYPVSTKQTINTLVSNQANYPFKFITYFNDSYYPSDDTFFEGIVNQYNTNGTLKLNNDTERTSFPISPCFSFQFITEKIAEMMGFTIQSDIFDIANANEPFYLGDLYLINNCDLGRQLEGTTIPYNIYAATLEYSYFMPELTAKEWIDGLRSTFALDITYDYDKMTMNIKRATSIINSNNYQDWSTKVIRFPTKTITERKNYKLAFKNTDDKIKFIDTYPAKNDLDSSLTYTPLEAAFTPVLNNKDKDSTLLIDSNEGIPSADGSAKTTLYQDQKYNTPEYRMCFYKGAAVGGHTIADNNTEKLSLSFADKDQVPGMLKVFFKDYLAFLNKTKQWTAFVDMTEDELLNIDLSAPVIAFDVPFLIETIQPKFPAKDVTQVKLLSL